ncbi:glutathione S-transferase family protein [Pseudolabrys sp. FHR47]|uniref:glutathione S-transferase family protein n=1 Tax=Pseudolabrys sp. FHR47 TaxID=2562284 RepID=UPI0010BE6FB1|nr:glutathione S-transferase family protein [Pseudolabrys sp. FHR47]
MTLKLYYHPLSSYCHKALIALYENDITFEPIVVDLSSEASSAPMRALWPVGKFPVLKDEKRGHAIAESSVIIDYLDTHYAHTRLIPADTDAAWQARMWDRFFDLYVMEKQGKLVEDNLRPVEARDPHGVAKAKEAIGKSYAIFEDKIGNGIWALGDSYSLADCAASPALFYANCAVPITDTTPKLKAYYERLMRRPSYLRALKEAEPFFDWVPMDVKPRLPA